LFRKYYGDQIADSIGIERKELSEYDRSHLKRLKSWIYNTQMKHLKPMLKESREEAKSENARKKDASKVATLFDFMDGTT
jgi:hypothetical protein